jgi:hypothetical protein
MYISEVGMKDNNVTVHGAARCRIRIVYFLTPGLIVYCLGMGMGPTEGAIYLLAFLIAAVIGLILICVSRNVYSTDGPDGFT